MLHAGPRACVSYVSLCALSGLCMFSCHANYIFCHRCSTQVCATSCPSLWRRNVKYHLRNGVPRSWLASMLVLPPPWDERWWDPWGRCDIVGCWSHWIAMWTLLRQRAAAPLWLLARNPKGIAIAWRKYYGGHCEVRIPWLRSRRQRCLSVAVMLGGSSCTILQYRLKILACMFAPPPFSFLRSKFVVLCAYSSKI